MQTATSAAGSRTIVCPQCGTINRVAAARPMEQAKCGKCKQRLFAGKPVDLTQANFHKHLEHNSIPLVIDLWAPWCAPCRMMAPVVERAAAALEPRYRLAKLNTEAEAELAARFGVRGIPTFVVFKAGAEVARRAGAMDYTEFLRWVTSAAQ